MQPFPFRSQEVRTVNKRRLDILRRPIRTLCRSFRLIGFVRSTSSITTPSLVLVVTRRRTLSIGGPLPMVPRSTVAPQSLSVCAPTDSCRTALAAVSSTTTGPAGINMTLGQRSGPSKTIASRAVRAHDSGGFTSSSRLIAHCGRARRFVYGRHSRKGCFAQVFALLARALAGIGPLRARIHCPPLLLDLARIRASPVTTSLIACGR